MTLRFLLIFGVLCPLLAQTTQVIIDTDAGSDDLMAIAFLLARDDVQIEAITVVHGLAHVRPGAGNVLKLLVAARKERIPVFMGSEKPLQKTAEFPKEWRDTSDRLLADLPLGGAKAESIPALEYYMSRSHSDRTVLALGPLTNLAQAVQRGVKFKNIVLMGGAVRVPGNLGAGGFYKTRNKTAEWNIFCDPRAADIVFRSGARIRMVGLDATNCVRLDLAFADTLKENAHSTLTTTVSKLLDAVRPLIAQGIFYAWDPLAAVATLHPAVVRLEALSINVRGDGTTAEDPKHGTVVGVAFAADARLFQNLYLTALR